jgi:hypothetical protein
MDWNSRLSTRLGKLLRDYAKENSLIFEPRTPTTNPYSPSATRVALAWLDQPSQAKVLTGGGDLAKRKSTSPCLLAIPAFGRIAGFYKTP